MIAVEIPRKSAFENAGQASVWMPMVRRIFLQWKVTNRVWSLVFSPSAQNSGKFFNYFEIEDGS